MLFNYLIILMNGCFGNYNEEQYKENKVMGYYYNKLIKKVLVMLRFNMFMERSRYYDDTRQNKQYNNEYNDKIFNFFHNENNDIANDNYKQYVEMFEHNNNTNNSNKHLNISSSSSLDKAQQTPIKDECESVTQVNELIDHLEYRYKQLLRKTKTTKQSLTTNNSIINSNNNDNTSSKIKRSSISMKVSPAKINRYIKAKQYCTKVNNKNIKRNSSHYNNKAHSKQICITCPYCVSNIKHNKCIVNGNKHQKQLPNQPQFDPNILLGAPSFSKNTFNFIHKNL